MKSRKKSYKSVSKKLYALAAAQQGYFTAMQAELAGYARSSQSYNVEMGNWIREHRGIYRLSNFPQPDRPDLLLWSLWSQNRKGKTLGTYSHQTALSIYDLSDIMPARLHMTVPPYFRRHSEIPGVLFLHKGNLKPKEVERMQGFQVTRPLRTITDLINENALSFDFIKQAVSQALRRGLLTREEIKKVRPLSYSTREKLNSIVAELGK